MSLRRNIIVGVTLLILISVGIYKSISSGLYYNTHIYAEGIDYNIIYHDIKKDFGIVLDSFYVEEKRIRRNQNLASILTNEGLENSVVNKATFSASDVFDIRKIKAGNYYNLYYSKHESKLSYIVYKHSPIEYLKIKIADNPKAERGEKEIISERAVCSGKISSSLWATMIENNIDPMMSIRLSEIYAWTVDFFGLDEGDEFKVVYEKQYVDSIPIGIGEIYAASFKHKDEELLAFEFEQNGVKSFYDEKGKSLRRQFLKAPLKFSRISSKFSKSRMHPILKIRRPHSGVDYSAPTGTPIHAIGDGTIVKKGYGKGAGYYIKVKHNSVYTSAYNHLSRYPKGMKVGRRVKQGDVIGYVGSTGYSTGPHLDFRIYKNGHAVDPLKIKAPPVEPIFEQNESAFKEIKIKLKKELDSIDS